MEVNVLFMQNQWKQLARLTRLKIFLRYPYQNLLQRIRKILLFLTAPSEPKITQRTDLTGNNWWEVYDPITGSSHVFNNEAEVRIWLEQRYYQ
jgi:hypothetical protein